MSSDDSRVDCSSLSPGNVFHSRVMGSLNTTTSRIEMLARHVERSPVPDAAGRDHVLRGLRSIARSANELEALVDKMAYAGLNGHPDTELPR